MLILDFEFFLLYLPKTTITIATNTILTFFYVGTVEVINC